MSIDRKFVELTADVLEIFFIQYLAEKLRLRFRFVLSVSCDELRRALEKPCNYPKQEDGSADWSRPTV